MIDVVRKLFGRSVVYGLGEITNRFLGLLLLPLYTAFLIPADYGVVSTIQVTVSLLSVFVWCGQHGVILRYYHDYQDDPDAQREFLSIPLILVLAITVLVVALFFLFGEQIARMALPQIPFYPFVVLAICTVAFNIVEPLQLALFRARGQALLYSIFQNSKFIITTLIVIYLVVFQKEGALGVVKGRFWGVALFFLIVLGWYVKNIRLRFDPAIALRSFRYGFFTVPDALAYWVIGLSSRMFWPSTRP